MASFRKSPVSRPSPLRVAVVQTRPRFGRPEENRDRARALLEGTPADLYVLPELAFSGYNFESAAQAASWAEPAAGPSGRLVGDFCRRRGAWVAYGFAETAGGRLYNAAALWGPRGLVGVYRKVHLFGREKRFFAPGDRFFVWTLPFGRVGLMVCFDWFFPEAMRTLALAGARVVLHPANLVLPHGPKAMVTRCLENRVFAATADRVGADPGGAGPVRFIGQSQILSPGGERLAALGRTAEGVAWADIDPARADDKRLSSGNDLFAERRPEAYRGNH